MKTSLLTTTAAAMFALSFTAGGASAAGKWDGADDLPTSPLACDAGGAAAPAAAKPYDGGQPTNPPDKAGKEITVVDVPKLIGIGYFNATSKGMQDAAKELGNVKVTTDGPTEAKIDEQIKFIDNYITRGVDGVLFAANDPVAIAPVLKKALSKGIHVVGYDANSTPDAREWFVNQAEFNGIGKSMVDSMAKEIGERQLRHRHVDIHDPQSGPLDCRDAGLCREMPSEDDLARDGRGAGGQQSVVQSGDDAHQQIRRQAEGPVRHDFGGDAGFSRSGHQGRPMRQDRRCRPRHAERDEALRQRRLRQVGGPCGTRSISATPRPTSCARSSTAS